MNEMAASGNQLNRIASLKSGAHQVVNSQMAKVVQRLILPIAFADDALFHTFLNAVSQLLLTVVLQEIVLINLMLFYLRRFFLLNQPFPLFLNTFLLFFSFINLFLTLLFFKLIQFQQ